MSHSPLEQQSRQSASAHLHSAEPLHGGDFNGQSLMPRVHRAMERLSGIDLSSLSIHAESPLPATFGARAFVCGDQIHFAPGEYDPWTSEGWRVLGHEVAHVVQQRLGRVARCPGSGALVSDPGLEAEADAAGDYAAQMFADDHLTCRPLNRSRNVPSSAIGEAVVQCLMTVEQFKGVTPGGMRNKIRAVDTSLAEYHKLNSGPMTMRNFPAILAQLRALYQCCSAYKMTRGTRGAGVDKLVREIALEEVVLVPLDAFHREADLFKKMDHLEQVQEYVLQMRVRPDFTWQGGHLNLITDIMNQLMDPLVRTLKGSPAGIDSVVRRDLEALTALPSQRITMPQILKDVIQEVTERPYVADGLTLGIGSPSGAINMRPGATTRFILSHGPQNLGRKFRMGALLHEMTHLSNADFYGNSIFMFAIPAVASDAEMLARARQRRANLEGLIVGFGSDNSLGEELKKEIIEKFKYPISGKFSNVYYGKMVEQKRLSDAEKVRYKQLSQDGMDCELIEYDSVINQTALWCELSGVNHQSNGNFANLLNFVGEAHGLRTSRS